MAHKIDKFGQVKLPAVTTQNLHRPKVCTFSSVACFNLPVGHPQFHLN